MCAAYHGPLSHHHAARYYHAPCISLGSIYNGTCYEGFPGPLPEGPGGKVTSIYANGSLDVTDDSMPDGMIADHAVGMLQKLADQEAPFFMAVGELTACCADPPAPIGTFRGLGSCGVGAVRRPGVHATPM